MIVDTPAKQLLFSTVRLVSQAVSGESAGTGFLMSDQVDEDTVLPYLVTNKHVLRGARRLVLEFIAKKPGSNEPQLGSLFRCEIHDPQWIEHPDPTVDVAVMPVGSILGALEEKVFFRVIPWSWTPQNDGETFIDAIEDVIIIGYPAGLRDEVTYTPIVRRGITATPIDSEIDGKPTFLVDSSIYGGSSGSPVFLYNQGTFTSGPSVVSVGTRVALVGIIAAVHVRNTSTPVITNHAPHVEIAQELNLGIVYNWHSIRATVDLMRQVNSL